MRSRREFFEAMDDDFNTPRAVTAYVRIVEIAGELTNSPGKIGTEVLETLRDLGSVLGVLLAEQASQRLFSELVQLLVELRAELRKKGEYALADTIRERLGQMGIIVEDTAAETRLIGQPARTRRAASRGISPLNTPK